MFLRRASVGTLTRLTPASSCSKSGRPCRQPARARGPVAGGARIGEACPARAALRRGARPARHRVRERTAVTTAARSGATGVARAIQAAPSRDRRLLRTFLEQDRLRAAYAVCDLDEKEFHKTKW